MNIPWENALFVLSAYLLGSFPVAFLIGKFARGIDLRYKGSGTLGASNVFYNVGAFWFIPVGLFDSIVKGYLPIMIAKLAGIELTYQLLIGFAAIIGHNWPIFLKFKGGRGVAPSLGVLLALGKLELAIFTIIACIGWQILYSAPLSVLLSFLALPLASIYLDKPLSITVLMVGLLVITILKRLFSNSLPTNQTNLKVLFIYRLIFDRDIPDNLSWVKK